MKAFLREAFADAEHVLDLGCGVGFYTVEVASVARRVTAVDLRPIYEQRFQRPNIKFQAADGCALPFSSHSFPRVFSQDVIEHIETDDKFLAEIWRVLKPGGMAIVVTPNRLRLVERLRRLIGRPTRFPHLLGRSPTLGEIYHFREYTREELSELAIGVGIPKSAINCRGFWLGYQPGEWGFGLSHLPRFLEPIAQLLILRLEKPE